MSKKVMLADDEESILALVAATLEDEDRYQLILSRDGAEAISLARREKPALLFLDIMMPIVDGYQVCRTLKQDPETASIKIIMLTALAQQFERDQAEMAGADDYFTKPFSPTALIEKVDEVLGENNG